MISDLSFLTYPIIAGIGMAIIAGPLGVFMIWRRMAFIGDTLSHSTLLGVSIALWMHWNIYAGVILVCILIALLLSYEKLNKYFAYDTLLGIISSTALAVGLVVAVSLSSVRVDLLSYLYGDILSVTQDEAWLTLLLAGAVLVWLVKAWRPLLSLTISPALAKVAGHSAATINLSYLFAVAITVALGMRLVGVILITAMLIIPAAASSFFARTPEQMSFISSVFGVIAVSIGMAISVYLDWPTGPTIVIMSSLIFIICFLFKYILND